MTYKLFEEVVLLKDIPEKKLKKGDVATIVEHHPVSKGEDGYSLEVLVHQEIVWKGVENGVEI